MLTGYAALVEQLKLSVPAPHTESRVEGSARRSEVHADRTREIYPRKMGHSGDPRAHLLFALRYEPAALDVLAAAFRALGPEFVRTWMLAQPTSGYARVTWFLYEFLRRETLDLPNAKAGAYANVLNPDRHFVGAARTSSRHRVRDNLLGVAGFCPCVRRTQKLASRVNQALDREVATLTKSVDPDVLRRAVSYLYTKETKSTFEIENERPSPQREERFIAALADAAKLDVSDKAALISLQNKIVDPRYAASDWRDFHNYVGETAGNYREIVRLICPKPEDVADLMRALSGLARRTLADTIDPVIAAALVSFGFVFIHPFEDGNGRIHRFLIHSVLSKTGFSPPGLIFPVSVSILRDRAAYDVALEKFSKPLLALIDWRLNERQELVVKGETADHYRYFDATTQAEYLYDRVAETIHKDLAEELDFIALYDRAYTAVRDIVDMPNKRLALFIRLCMQNNGRLAKAKRKAFAELTDAEIAAMEAAIASARRSHEVGKRGLAQVEG
jgi:Fic family protein